jgi:hypothetical protein
MPPQPHPQSSRTRPVHTGFVGGAEPPSRMRSAGRLSGFAMFLAFTLLAGPSGDSVATAESRITLEAPPDFEAIRATTFDEAGREVGHSSFEMDTLASGAHRMKIELAVSGGGVNRSEAILAPIQVGKGPERSKLRLTEQRSQATRADGVSLDLIVIDHIRGRASCYPSDASDTSDTSDENDAEGRHIDLPEDDRVVNVPLQLLFKPLARGEVENVRFQLVLCRSGPVLQDMVAVRGPRGRHHSRDVIEIRFGPDLGDAIAWFASRLLPRFSFWFDESQGQYLGHRMPLHRKGPKILLVRQGLQPPDLGLRMR